MLAGKQEERDKKLGARGGAVEEGRLPVEWGVSLLRLV